MLGMLTSREERAEYWCHNQENWCYVASQVSSI